MYQIYYVQLYFRNYYDHVTVIRVTLREMEIIFKDVHDFLECKYRILSIHNGISFTYTQDILDKKYLNIEKKGRNKLKLKCQIIFFSFESRRDGHPVTERKK